MAGQHRVRRINYLTAYELYCEGKTDEQIAEYFGCVSRTIAEWRRREKLPANLPEEKARKQAAKKKSSLTPFECDAIAAREAGMTYGQYKAQQYLAAHPYRKAGKK